MRLRKREWAEHRLPTNLPLPGSHWGPSCGLTRPSPPATPPPASCPPPTTYRHRQTHTNTQTKTHTHLSTQTKIYVYKHTHLYIHKHTQNQRYTSKHLLLQLGLVCVRRSTGRLVTEVGVSHQYTAQEADGLPTFSVLSEASTQVSNSPLLLYLFSSLPSFWTM